MHPKVYEALKNSDFESKEQESGKAGEGEDFNQPKSKYLMEKINEAALKFIIKERLPLSKLDSDHFKNLISVCLGCGKQTKLLSRKSGREKIKVRPRSVCILFHFFFT